VKPAVVAVLALVTPLAGLAIIWIAPVVGAKNSACRRYPYASGCR